MLTFKDCFLWCRTPIRESIHVEQGGKPIAVFQQNTACEYPLYWLKVSFREQYVPKSDAKCVI